MPPTDLQLALGTKENPVELAWRVHGFLAKQPDLGFSAAEIAPEVCLSEDATLLLLEELTFFGAVDARVVERVEYFRYARDLKPGELREY
jgi:hypothetical protein